MTFTECLGIIAPYYNLVLVAIVIVLFIKLFMQKKKGIYNIPWYFLFIAIILYVIEESMTVMASVGFLEIPPLLFPIFEMMMISLFIYMLLLQKDYIKTIR